MPSSTTTPSKFILACMSQYFCPFVIGDEQEPVPHEIMRAYDTISVDGLTRKIYDIEKANDIHVVGLPSADINDDLANALYELKCMGFLDIDEINGELTITDLGRVFGDDLSFPKHVDVYLRNQYEKEFRSIAYRKYEEAA